MYMKKVWKIAGCLALCCCLHLQPLFAAAASPGEETTVQEQIPDEEDAVSAVRKKLTETGQVSEVQESLAETGQASEVQEKLTETGQASEVQESLAGTGQVIQVRAYPTGEKRTQEVGAMRNENDVMERFRRFLLCVLAADVAVSVIYIRRERKRTETSRGMFFIEKKEEENDVSKKKNW